MADARHLEAIRKSLFFNSAYYLETNPDVRAAGMDPAFHYLVHGGREGRDQAENEEPQPQVLFTFGLPNLKPEPCRPST